jgi:polyhydroxyalkanoate synthesis regulator phasin
MAKILILTTLGTNNDVYNRLQKLEAEVVKKGLKMDLNFKECDTSIKGLKTDIKEMKDVLREKLAKQADDQQERFIRFYARGFFGVSLTLYITIYQFLMKLRSWGL